MAFLQLPCGMLLCAYLGQSCMQTHLHSFKALYNAALLASKARFCGMHVCSLLECCQPASSASGFAPHGILLSCSKHGCNHGYQLLAQKHACVLTTEC
jgi:hypothetical protein